MVFTHDTDLVLRHAAALVNTARARVERGRGPARRRGRPRVDGRVAVERRPPHRRRRGRRPAPRPARIERIWTAPLAEQVAEVNALLADAGATPRLVEHDGQGWHVHATDDDAPFAQRVAVELAMAMVDVIRADERARLAVCSADDCDDVYVDLSRNRSRKFCEGTCGTRANVAAYRARRAAAGS